MQVVDPSKCQMVGGGQQDRATQSLACSESLQDAVGLELGCGKAGPEPKDPFYLEFSRFLC